MFPVLNIGPFAIQATMLLLLLGLWFAMSVGSRYAPRFGLESKFLDDLILISILFGLIGGRLFYVLRFPGAFLENPTSILSLNPELFLPSGGLLVGGITFLVILQRRKKPLWQTLDALTLPLAIFAVFLGISHLASGKVFGMPTSLPWAIELWGAARHPTQLYEILAAAIVAGFTWRNFEPLLREPHRAENQPGLLFLTFASMTALAWIIIEPFRGDSVYLAGNIRLVQVVAFLVLLTCFYFMRQLRNQPDQKLAPGLENE